MALTGRQQAAVDHLKLVGRDVHRYGTYALAYGLTPNQIKQAIADGVQEAEGGDQACHVSTRTSGSTSGRTTTGAV